jgi:FtsP/CotA-like multicopper oxidase with cupredoxin domain
MQTTQGNRNSDPTVTWFSVIICAMVGSLIYSHSTCAEERLLEPRITASQAATLPILLTAQNASAEIAGIGTVEGLFLFGVSPDSPSLIPATWQVKPGQSIRLILKNRLTCQRPASSQGVTTDQTNIHLHGTLVSPHDKDKSGYYGDFSFVTVNSQGPGCTPAPQPNAITHGAMEVELGQANYAIDVPVDHPSGLYWYHPHVHSVAEAQVGGGMSGLVSIGSIWDYAYITCNFARSASARCATPDAKQKENALRASTDEHYLMLKDLQLDVTAANQWRLTDTYDSGLCDTTPNNFTLGYCDSPDAKKRWLFTVNGQHLPNTAVAGGRGSVLRIANVSANVSYVLALRVQLTDGRNAYAPFQVLAVDGVRRSTSATGPMTSTQLTMMPAARAELYVSSTTLCSWLTLQGAADQCSGVIHTILEQQGTSTGANGEGDKWPQVDLASIDFDSAGRGAAPMLNVSGVIASNIGNEPSGPRLTVKSATPPAPKAALAKCQDGTRAATLDTDKGQYRLIALKNGKCINGKTSGCDPADPNVLEEFGMVTESSRTLTGTPADAIPTMPYRPFDHGRVDLCVGAPIATGTYEETWVVSNQAKELHNFHVHQSKFEVLEVNPGPNPELASKRPAVVGQFHDTYPIDAGGWIKLRIKFNRSQQVGKFVYHCHILDHEDNGMMSVIQVVNTSRL